MDFSQSDILLLNDDHAEVDENDCTTGVEVIIGEQARKEGRMSAERVENEHAKGGNEATAAPTLDNIEELTRQINAMHNRCIVRNLRAAGLGTYNEEEEKEIYGDLTPGAQLPTGESMLWAIINYIDDHDKQARYIGILMIEKVDVNECYGDLQQTPLMVTIQRGLEKSCKTLLQSREIDHLIGDNEGNTALHYMGKYGRDQLLRHYFKVLRRLELRCLAGKENIHTLDIFNAVNNAGQTAHVFATEIGQNECARLIEDEKIKKMKILNRSLSFAQHINSPSLNRGLQQGRRLLKRLASFDSLKFDNPLMPTAFDPFSDEEAAPMIASSDSQYDSYVKDITDQNNKERKEKPITRGHKDTITSGISPIVIRTNKDSNRLDDSATRRAKFFQSKGEMFHRETSDYNVSSFPPEHKPVAVARSMMTTTDPTIAQIKPKLADRIRSLLVRHRQKYGSLRGSGSFDNLTTAATYQQHYDEQEEVEGKNFAIPAPPKDPNQSPSNARAKSPKLSPFNERRAISPTSPFLPSPKMNEKSSAISPSLSLLNEKGAISPLNEKRTLSPLNEKRTLSPSFSPFNERAISPLSKAKGKNSPPAPVSPSMSPMRPTTDTNRAARLDKRRSSSVDVHYSQNNHQTNTVVPVTVKATTSVKKNHLPPI